MYGISAILRWFIVCGYKHGESVKSTVSTKKAVQWIEVQREGSTVDRSTEKAVQWIEVQRRQYSGEKYKEGSTVDRSTKKAVKWIEVQRRQYIG